MSAKKYFLISSLIIIITSICATAEAKSVSGTIDSNTVMSGPYGMRAGQPRLSNITNHDVSVIHATSMHEASTTLAYRSYIFTTEDIVLFSYEDGTQLELYDSSGNPVPINPNVLDKGEHTYVDTSQGVYLVAGSNKFAVLTGDATTTGVSGYYAMDADGRGVSREFYTYAPVLYEHCEFIVFAYENGTSVTVQEEVSNGVYTDIASFTLDKGKHWDNSSISGQYLHIVADKPVSALTCYDQSYFVPSANGMWSGTEFYTYVSDIEGWPEDLTVIAYNDGTSVGILDSDNPNVVIWSGTLNNGQAHVESYPGGANKYFTITSSKPVTVSVQPWVADTSSYYQGTFVPGILGTGVGTDLIGSTLDGGYFYILAYADNTHVNLYNAQTGAWQASYTLNKGETVNANPGNGLWRIISDKDVSAYSEWGDTWQAAFAPLFFNTGSLPPSCDLELTKIDDVNSGDCVGLGRQITYTIDYNYPAGPNLPDINDVNIIDYLPAEVDFDSASNGGSYDSNSHAVIWNLGVIHPGNAGSVTLTVELNHTGPGSAIINHCDIRSSGQVIRSAYEYTPVCYAHDPYPEDDANVRALSEPLQLSWSAGDLAAAHRVFFGTQFSAVLHATTGNTDGRYRGTVSNPVYPLSRLMEKGANLPGASYVLNVGQTYYWRIDEVNGTNVWKGDTWAFTPGAYINIDDFENYNSTAGLTANWQYGYTITHTGADNGCNNSSATGKAGRALIQDATGKHLQYTYNNDGTHPEFAGVAFSETKRSYIGGTSFTGAGVISPALMALRIDYKGRATNAANNISPMCGDNADMDRMYAAIEDTAGNVAVYLNPDPNAQLVGNWTSWYIALKDINDINHGTGPDGNPHTVNLNAITGFAIGFGIRGDVIDTDGVDANSIVMFDNIRLYPPACVPQFGPTADLDGDCDVDINDLDILANDWLLKAETRTFAVTQPAKAPILWYKFNESGQNNTPIDSGTGDPNLYTGTVTNFIAQNWDVDGGHDGNGCLYLPSDAGCYVNAPVASLGFMGDANHTTPGGGGISFSVWINADTTSDNMRNEWNGLFSVWNRDVNVETLVVHCPSPFPPTDPIGPRTIFIKTSPSAAASAFNMRESDYGGKWNHWAFTKSDYSLKVYCNGTLMGHCDANGQPGDPNANAYGPLFDKNVGAFRIGTSGGNWGMWNGRIDDFQVYDYCLSDAEVAYLATDGSPGIIFIPLISPANINTDGSASPSTDVNQIVNFGDLAIMGKQWHTQILWP
jgi:hypothetical protein